MRDVVSSGQQRQQQDDRGDEVKKHAVRAHSAGQSAGFCRRQTHNGRLSQETVADMHTRVSPRFLLASGTCLFQILNLQSSKCLKRLPVVLKQMCLNKRLNSKVNEMVDIHSIYLQQFV